MQRGLFGESTCLSCQAQHLSLTQNDLENPAESGVFSSQTGPKSVKSVKSVIALWHRHVALSFPFWCDSNCESSAALQVAENQFTLQCDCVL
jgi:hypothetical protein